MKPKLQKPKPKKPKLKPIAAIVRVDSPEGSVLELSTTLHALHEDDQSAYFSGVLLADESARAGQLNIVISPVEGLPRKKQPGPKNKEARDIGVALAVLWVMRAFKLKKTPAIEKLMEYTKVDQPNVHRWFPGLSKETHVNRCIKNVKEELDSCIGDTVVIPDASAGACIVFCQTTRYTIHEHELEISGCAWFWLCGASEASFGNVSLTRPLEGVASWVLERAQAAAPNN